MTKIKSSVKIILSLLLVITIVSFFLPHLEKLGFKQNFPDANPYIEGTDFMFARISFLLILVSTLTFLYKPYFWRPFIYSLLNLPILVLLYYSYKFPSPAYIYEGIETKPAYGFYLLLIVSILHFLTCAIYLFVLKHRNLLPVKLKI